MTYNFNKIKRTSKMFTFADDSRLRVVRVSQKGEQTKWTYIRFEPGASSGSVTSKHVGNGWAWIDATEIADRYADFCGKYKVKVESTDNY